MTSPGRRRRPILVVAVVSISAFVGTALPVEAQVGGKVVVVTIATTHGDITAEIYVDRSPMTAENFLTYVDFKVGHNFIQNSMLS